MWEQIVDGQSQITADKPILVAQYSNGTSYDGVTSDPFEMLIPPTEQFLPAYTVSTPAAGFSGNYINVVAPTSSLASVKFDGTVVPAASFAPIGSTGFSGAQLSVELGSHTVTGSSRKSAPNATASGEIAYVYETARVGPIPLSPRFQKM